jgi:hypothetical protein
MLNAAKCLIAFSILTALAGCKKDPGVDANVIAADNAGADANVLANNSFDTLPPDESSSTPSNQLVNGFDNPDVNDVDTNNSD